MKYENLIKTKLFRGIEAEDLKAMLQCLGAFTQNYKKDEVIYRTGERILAMGIVMSGSVNVENHDVRGNKNILDNIGCGQVFAEAYACVPGERMMVDATAAEDTEILFLNVGKVLKTCPKSCVFHSRLIANLLEVLAIKNLNLTRKISHISPKTIRERLLSYLSFQAMQQGEYDFEIPFNRQQLADYLGVDRSAMSNELGKMQREGLLVCKKSRFHLREGLYRD